MPNVRKMPGSACRHYAAGRCLYTERLNPGYDETLRCRFLALCEREFDDLLDRAEVFGLGQGQVASLWDRRFQRICDRDSVCPRHRFDPDGGEQCCANAQGDVCLLSLPRCEGRCRHFSPLPSEADGSTDDNDKES